MTNFDDERDKELQQAADEGAGMEEQRSFRTFERGSLAEREWIRESREEQRKLREGDFLYPDGSVPTRRQLDDELGIREDVLYSQSGKALAVLSRQGGPGEIYLRLDDERDHERGLYRINNPREVEQQLRDLIPARHHRLYDGVSDYEVIAHMREAWHHRDDDGQYHGTGMHARIDEQRLVRQGRVLETNNAQVAAEELAYRVVERGLRLDQDMRMTTPMLDRAAERMPDADIHPTHHLHDHRAKPTPKGIEVVQQFAAEVAERLPWRRPEQEAEPTLDDRRQAFAERQWRSVHGAVNGGEVNIHLGAERDDDSNMVVVHDPRAAAKIIRGNFLAQNHAELSGKSTGELLAMVVHDTEGLSGIRYADDLRRDGRVFADDERQQAAEELSYRLSQKEYFQEAYSTLSYEQQRERQKGLEL